MNDYFYLNYNVDSPVVKQGLIRVSKSDMNVEIYDRGCWKALSCQKIKELERQIQELQNAIGEFEVLAEAIIGERSE